MKRCAVSKSLITLFVLVSLSCSLMLGVFAQLSPGCVFYGFVTIGGSPAPDYLNVTAAIAGTSLSWSTTTKNGTYGWPLKGGISLFIIPPQSENSSTKDGGSNGDFIQFYVNGTKADQTSVFDSSGAYEVDLYIAGSIPEQPTLTVSINCSTTYPNYKVEISGRLVNQNGNGIAGTNLVAAYSPASDQSWKSIGSFNSTLTGDYNVEWILASTGNYIVRVSWGGNGNFNAVEAFMNLTTLALEQKYVFSVISNSTISELTFNSTSRVLSLTLNSPSGKTGYANATIAKDLIADPNGLKMYLDGNQIGYTTLSSSTAWLLGFTYQQGMHQIDLDLGQPTQPFLLTPLGIATLSGIVAILLAIIFISHNRLARPKKTKLTKSSLKSQKSRALICPA